MSETLARIDQSEIGQWEVAGGRWAGLIFFVGGGVFDPATHVSGSGGGKRG